MRFWFDTEFYEDGETIELISIGVVSEDGRTYYAETIDSDYFADKLEWLQKNVKPLLTGPRKARTDIKNDLIKFMGEGPEIWGYFADYDWVVLCQLYGTMMQLPKGWPMICFDVRQQATMSGIGELPKQTTPEHHALNDAKWTKAAWQFVETRRMPAHD